MANKDAFWFSHDCNARHDEKISAMRSVYKAEGYGLYWMLIEIMREQNNYKITIANKYSISALALQLNVEDEKLKKFIDDCVNEFKDGNGNGLFSKDENFLWSDSLLRRMKQKDIIAKKRSSAGRKSAEKRQQKLFDEESSNIINANDEQMIDNCSTNAEQNSTKIKENKIKENKIEYINNIFEDFWNAYPKRNGKKIGKKECSIWWNKHVNDSDIADKILQSALLFAKTSKAKTGYAEDPIRFLKHERYLDYLQEDGNNGNYTKQNGTGHLDHSDGSIVEPDYQF